MKKAILYIASGLVLVGAIINLTGCKDEELDGRGVVMVTVWDATSWKAVPNANLVIFRSLEDWSDDVHIVATAHSDANGELVLPRLAKWNEYYIDVTKDELSNWPDRIPYEVEDHVAQSYTIYVNPDFNRLISRVGGRTWKLWHITGPADEDLSADPQFSCLIGNKETFHKSGFYEIDRGPSLCSPDPVFAAGSFWNQYGYALYIFPEDGSEPHIYQIGDRNEDSFTLLDFVDGKQITLHYELSQ